MLQNCSLFEEEQVALHLQSHLDRFGVLYEKTLQSKKQHKWIHFSHRYKLVKTGNFFLIYEAIEKQLFFIFQPILKISDLTNPCYIKQNFSDPLEFPKMRDNCKCK